MPSPLALFCAAGSGGERDAVCRSNLSNEHNRRSDASGAEKPCLRIQVSLLRSPLLVSLSARPERCKTAIVPFVDKYSISIGRIRPPRARRPQASDADVTHVWPAAAPARHGG